MCTTLARSSATSAVEPRERAGAVAQQHGEPYQAPVLHEPALDDPRQHGDVDVAAGEHEDHRAPLEAELPVEERSERCGAGALHHRLLDLEQQEHRARQLLLAHGHEVVDVGLRERERPLAHLTHGDAVRDGRRGVETHRAAFVQRVAHRRERVGLHADDAHLRPPRLHRQAHATREPAAADGHDDRLDVRPLLQHLEADRALAGDDPLIVERWTKNRSRAAPIPLAWSYASSKLPPKRMTSAPSRRAEVTFTSGAHSGMTMTAGMPSCAAW